MVDQWATTVCVLFVFCLCENVDNVLADMLRQNGQRKGCACIRTFYGTCLPFLKSPTCCAADYFWTGCRTSAKTAAHKIASAAFALRPTREQAGAAFHLHARWLSHHPEALATQSTRRIMRAHFNTQTLDHEKSVWSKALLFKAQSVCLFLNLPFLPTRRAHVRSR